MITHRVADGIYETADGRFRVQRHDNGREWMLLAITEGRYGQPEYEWWNTFQTKRDALAAAQEA